MNNQEISNEQSDVVNETRWQLNTVTPLSKYLAIILFVALPFSGGWVGYTYAPEKIVEVETIIQTNASNLSNSQAAKLRTQSDAWLQDATKGAEQHNFIINEIENQINIDLAYLLVEPNVRSRDNMTLGFTVGDVNPDVAVELIEKVEEKSVYYVTIFGEENDNTNDCNRVGSHCFHLVYDNAEGKVLFTEGDVIQFAAGFASPVFQKLTDDYIIFVKGFGSATDCQGGGYNTQSAYFFDSKEIVQKKISYSYDNLCAEEPDSIPTFGETEYSLIYENNSSKGFTLPKTRAVNIDELFSEVFDIS